MAEISAADVKALRDKTGLPMMECKEALKENGGNQEAAIEYLRKKGNAKMIGRGDRETSTGRIACFADVNKGVGAMVEVLCESDPVVKNDEFIQLSKDLVTQLATGPGAKTADELLDQMSPSKPGTKLRDQWEDLTNRIREVFRLARLLRIDGPCGAYAHHTGTDGVLVEVKGSNQAVANDIAMHVAGMKPKVARKEDMDAAEVEKEKAIQMDIARGEGKPENILAKMVEGRMRVFYEQHVLLEQPFVKEEKKSVGKVAAEAKLEVIRFVHWKLGKA